MAAECLDNATHAPEEDFFRAIVESSTDFIFAKDRHLRYLSVNAAAASAVNKHPDEIIGKDDFFLFPDDAARAIRQVESALLADGQPRAFYETLPLNGNVRQLYTTKDVVRDSSGAVIGLVGISRDITALKNTEDALREAAAAERARRAEIATMMEAIPAAVIIAHDSLCCSMTGNREVHELLEVQTNKNLSKSAPSNEAPQNFEVYSNGRKMTPAELPVQTAASSGKPVREVELELHFSDGRRRTIFGNALPLFDEQGAPRGAIGAFLDVSAYKRLQEELRSANESKDTFLATLAHEIRNPLATLSNCMQVLSESPNTQARTGAENMMVRQIAQLTRLTNDLLDGSRIEKGKLRIERTAVDLIDVLSLALDTSRVVMERSDHRLILKLPSAPIVVYGDSARLVQLFVNLLNNAAKFTPAHGEIRLSVSRTTSKVIVSVKDNGIGIAKELLSRIFEIYVQADTPSSRAQVGLGIGLSLVRYVAELHDGTVEVFSGGLDQGAEFVVRLPIMMPH